MQVMQSELNWHDYAAIFLRRKWFFIVPLVLALGVAITLGFTMPKVYRAYTSILVKEEKTENPLIRGLAASTSVRQRMGVLRAEILSWNSVVRLVNQLELDTKIKGDAVSYEKLIKSLIHRTSVGMKGKDIIQIAFVGEDPKQAQKLVNTLSVIFTEQNVRNQEEESDNAISFLEEQIEVYKKKLEESEDALRKFKEVYSIEMPKTTALNNSLASLELRLANLLVENTEKHPAVLEVQRQIESLKEKRNQEIVAAAKAVGLDLTPEEYLAIAESRPRQQQELAQLQRDYDVNNGIYNNLIQRLEHAKITLDLDTSDQGTAFKVLEPARLPLTPFKPNKMQLLMMGLFIGSAAGIGLIFLVEYFDHSFRDAEDLKGFLGLPVLGIISTIVTDEDIQRRRHVWQRPAIQLILFLLCLFVGGAVTIFLTYMVK